MKDSLFNEISDLRYERKFFIESASRAEIEHAVQMHPFMFREIYTMRRVNNIYFDTIKSDNYFDNVDGVSRRLKARIRYYGESFGKLKDPALELKSKESLNVGKRSFPLKSFYVDKSLTQEKIFDVFKDSLTHKMLVQYLRDLSPRLLNSYSRKYFLSADKRFRITVDSDLTSYKLFSHHNNFLFKTKDPRNIILEIKYSRDDAEGAQKVSNYFSFRMTKHSKFVDGLDALSV